MMVKTLDVEEHCTVYFINCVLMQAYWWATV